LPDNYTGIIDLPIFHNISRYHIFLDKIHSCGYSGINIWLTPIWTNSIPLPIAKSLQHVIGSFHGTSIKRSFKTGVTYNDIIHLDKKTVDTLDPGRKIWVNYDLYLWHDKDIVWSDDFKKTQAHNIQKLSQKLWIKNPYNSEYLLYKYIIKKIAEVYHDDRTIYFEMPGTKWWSMISEISSSNLETVCSLIHNYLPKKGKICIDIWHMLTRSRTKNEIDSMIQTIEKYSSHIAMIHISSAWSYDPNFQLAYRHYTNNKYPDRHIKWLDFQWIIYEDLMVSLIEKIRTIMPWPIIEVCESRLLSASIQDYFETNILWEDIDRRFLEHIDLQAQILWYRSSRDI